MPQILPDVAARPLLDARGRHVRGPRRDEAHCPEHLCAVGPSVPGGHAHRAIELDGRDEPEEP
jgi:hypothetical protein